MTTSMTEPNDIPVVSGRCATCRFVRTYPLPLRDIHFCGALKREMTGQDRDEVRDCAAWEAYRPLTRRTQRVESASDEIARHLLGVENNLFALVRQSLEAQGADLRTVILMAHPNVYSAEDLSWLNDLSPQTATEPLSALLVSLRRLSYESLADHLEPFAAREEARGSR